VKYFGLISVAERRGWMSQDDGKAIFSRGLGTVNGKADLDMLFAGADGSITSDDTNLRRNVTYHTYTDNETVTVDAVLVRLLCCVCDDTVVLASQEARERTRMVKSADAIAAGPTDIN